MKQKYFALFVAFTMSLAGMSNELVLNITVAEAGNILNYLPMDKLSDITSLTISGKLYETDIAIVKMCTNLKYLNMANATISESPEGSKRRKKSWDFQYPHMPNCYIPSNAFSGMKLIEVVLPKTVKLIRYSAFRDCLSLQRVYLGESLMIIERGAFANTSLSEVKFPKSLIKIEGDAFDNVATLREIDLSACIMEDFYDFVRGAEENARIGCLPNLDIFKMPQGMTTFNPFVTIGCSNLKDVYVGKDVKVIYYSLDHINLHFQSEIAPEIKFEKITNCTIYVPKNGNITSYYATFNCNGNKIIQEQ